MAESTKASSGATAGTVMTSQRGGEALLAFAGDDDRRRLVGAVDRDLLGDVVGGGADEAGARTRGSAARDDRSMCFLSSVTSQAIDL